MNQTQRFACTLVTVCSSARESHLRNQLLAVHDQPDVETIVVWMDEVSPPTLMASEIILVPPGQHGMKLAAARNAGANRAIERGADLIVFLDADCIPGEELFTLYARAAVRHPMNVLCGPVTYLPPEVSIRDPRSLAAATNPHPARPDPPAGQVLHASVEEFRLFWSLSFAMTANGWRAAPGFHEAYQGYGAEDTDFAFSVREAGMPLTWVGGAHAYHQYHPTTSPPWQHLDDILRNGAIFAERWGEWPMAGWLTAFEAAGAIERYGSGWHRTAEPR